MKTLITTILLVLSVQGAVAQQTIEDIRKAYASAKEYIGMMSDDFPGEGIPPEYYHLHVSQMLPATGLHREDIRLYYNDVEEENKEEPRIYPLHYLRFASTKYNYAAREFYEEYLYDDDGKIAFIYARTPDAHEDLATLHDLRFYFSNGKLIRATVKSGPLDATELKDIYSGTTVPKQYDRIYQSLLLSAKNYMGLFESIENTTHL